MKSLSDTHIFISGMGSKGDIHPLVGIAKELRGRNAGKITFLANDTFKDLITSHEFGFISTGSEENQIEFINDERVWDPECDTTEIGWVRTIRPAIEISIKAVEEAHKSGEQVLIVGIQYLLNGAFIAAEMYDLPAVHITLAPWQIAEQSVLSPAAPLRWFFRPWHSKDRRRRIIDGLREDFVGRMKQKDHFWQLNGMRRYRKLKTINDYSADVVFPEKCLTNWPFSQLVRDG